MASLGTRDTPILSRYLYYLTLHVPGHLVVSYSHCSFDRAKVHLWDYYQGLLTHTFVLLVCHRAE